MQPIPILAALAFGCFATAAQAQSSPAGDESQAPPGFSLGVGVVASGGSRAGESTRTLVVPIVGYEGERIFFRGISGGVHLLRRGGFEVDALVAARLDGWDADDLGVRALAGAGVDRALLRDRDNGVDAGLGLSWRGAGGKLSAQAKADVSSASQGYELKFDYGFPLTVGRGTLVPGAGVSYWSDRLAGYYYGTLAQEEAAGVPRYRLGGAVVPQVSLAYLRPLPGRWQLIAALEYRWLPGELTDSPLLEGSGGVPTAFLGFSRSFGQTR